MANFGEKPPARQASRPELRRIEHGDWTSDSANRRTIPLPPGAAEAPRRAAETSPGRVAEAALTAYLVDSTPRTRLIQSLDPQGPAMKDLRREILARAAEAASALQHAQAVRTVFEQIDDIAARVIEDHREEVLG